MHICSFLQLLKCTVGGFEKNSHQPWFMEGKALLYRNQSSSYSNLEFHN